MAATSRISALYEMVRRRCRCIVLSDAGCDPDYGFEDLGNAVRKISIDLGVYISFGELRAAQEAVEGQQRDRGRLLRDRRDRLPDGAGAATGVRRERLHPLHQAGYHGTESAGVVAYATANAAFPHESTGDQFFSESQFESYHTLGFEIMDSVLKRGLERVGQKRRDDKRKDQPPPTICEIIEALARPADDEKPPRLSDALKFLDKEDLAAARKIHPTP